MSLRKLYKLNIKCVSIYQQWLISNWNVSKIPFTIVLKVINIQDLCDKKYDALLTMAKRLNRYSRLIICLKESVLLKCHFWSKLIDRFNGISIRIPAGFLKYKVPNSIIYIDT